MLGAVSLGMYAVGSIGVLAAVVLHCYCCCCLPAPHVLSRAAVCPAFPPTACASSRSAPVPARLAGLEGLLALLGLQGRLAAAGWTVTSRRAGVADGGRGWREATRETERGSEG